MSASDGSAVWSVVVNWNGGEENLECLRSLCDQGIDEGRIVFVDNASTDGSLERVAAEHPGLVLLRNETNEGYGDATNRGIEVALERGADLVLLANNDVAFPAGTLALLQGALSRREAAGIVAPRIVYKDRPDRVWCAGAVLTFRQNLSHMIGHGKPDGPRYRVTRAVDYVPGAAMLVRRVVFERVGLLEGDYFAYHEDVELCLRARRSGFEVLVVGEALALHSAHASTGGGYNPARKYMMGLNTVRFLRRHGTPVRWLSFLVFDVVSLPLVWLWRAPRGEGAAVLAKARGMLDAFRGRKVGPEGVPWGPGRDRLVGGVRPPR